MRHRDGSGGQGQQRQRPEGAAQGVGVSSRNGSAARRAAASTRHTLWRRGDRGHLTGRPRAMPGGKSAGRQGHPPPSAGNWDTPPCLVLGPGHNRFPNINHLSVWEIQRKEILKLFTCCPNFQILKNKEICLVSAMYEHCRQSSHSQSSKSHVVSRGSTKITQQATK